MDRHQPTAVNKESRSVLEILREKKIAASLAVGIGIAALTGCAAAEGTEPKPSASSSAEATPTTTPEPTETKKPEVTTPAPQPPVETATPEPVAPEVTPVASSYEFDIPKETVDQLLTLDDAEFLKLPIEERVKVPLYFANKIGIKKKNDEFVKFSKDPLDALPEVLSPENTAEEIIAWDAALTRLALTVENANSRQYIDQDIFRKIAAGSNVSGASSPGYQALMWVMDEHIKYDGGETESWAGMGIQGRYKANKIADSSEVYKDSVGRLSIDITLFNKPDDLTPIKTTLQWVPISEDQGVWLQY